MHACGFHLGFGLLLALFGIFPCGLGAQEPPEALERESRGLNLERLRAADRNQDGKLAESELSEQLWKRLRAFDSDASGDLDAQEIKALTASKGNGADEERRPGGANSSFQISELRSANGQRLRYSLFVPQQAPPGLPLVLCLHGAGGNTAAANLLAAPASQAQHPCIVLAPECEGRGARWVTSSFRANPKQRSVTSELMETLAAVVATTKANPRQVYVTGQSMGGVGAWGLIEQHPERFAAAIPICGIWEPEDAVRMKSVPVWAFHGAKDPTVPVAGSRAMIAALKAAGADPRYTEFPEVGHGSWDAAYATPGLWDWLFAQRRKEN